MLPDNITIVGSMDPAGEFVYRTARLTTIQRIAKMPTSFVVTDRFGRIYCCHVSGKQLVQKTLTEKKTTDEATSIPCQLKETLDKEHVDELFNKYTIQKQASTLAVCPMQVPQGDYRSPEWIKEGERWGMPFTLQNATFYSNGEPLND